MKGTQIRNYRNKKGTKVFVYEVSGTQDELAKFKEIQGEFYRESDTGKPLWFSPRACGKAVDLIVTSQNKIVADMSRFDEAASLAEQYGGNLGDQLAAHAAGQLMGTNVSVSSTPPASQEEGPEGDEDL